MATTHDEKQKKGFIKNFYKFSTKNRRPNKSEPIDIVTNKIVSRKSKNYQEMEQGGGMRAVDHGGKFMAAARKSVSQVETNIESVGAFLQVKVLVSDMPAFMQVHAFKCARTTFDSLMKFSPKHLAFNIKKEFDKVYGPAWHCIVGSSFGSFVTHSTGCFLYFTMEKLYILVFKTKVQRALDFTN